MISLLSMLTLLESMWPDARAVGGRGCFGVCGHLKSRLSISTQQGSQSFPLSERRSRTFQISELAGLISDEIEIKEIETKKLPPPRFSVFLLMHCLMSTFYNHVHIYFYRNGITWHIFL